MNRWTWSILLLLTTSSVDGVIADDETAMQATRVADAIDELSSGDAIARELAVDRLIQAGNAALPALVDLLDRDPAPLVGVAARRAYGAIVGVSLETARLIEGRVAGLDPEDGEQVQTAAMFVVDQGRSAIRYLTAGEERFPPALVRRVRVLAAVRDLAEGDNAHDLAARSIRNVGDRVVDDLREIAWSRGEPTWRAVAAERMLQLGGADAFDDGLALLERGPVLRRVVVPFLCDDAPEDRFRAIVSKVSAYDRDEPELGTALERYAARVSPDVLRAVLARKLPARARAFAARMCGVRRIDDARGELAQLVRADEPELVEQALIALGRIGDEDDFDKIADRLGHANPRIRRAAVSAFGALGTKETIPWLAASLADVDASVRARTAQILAMTESDRAIDPLIAVLDDDDPNVLAAATHALRRLTSESFDTVAATSGSNRRRASRDAWRDWSQRRWEKSEDEVEEEEAADLALPMAADGARILSELASLLRREFRAYGPLKDEDGTSEAKLVRAAVKRMREVVDRAPGDDESERLRLGSDGKKVLRHLLENGRFGGVGELARMVGSLPIELGARDYILLTYEAADAIVRSLGDRFTRLSILSDASGEIKEDALPAVFGKQESVGMFLDIEDAGARVEFVLALSPADRAGLRVGDRVLSINGELTAGMAPREAAKLLLEPVELLVLRDGWSQPVLFQVEPEPDDPDAVVTHAMLPGKIGYVRLRGFEAGCAQSVEWALRALEKDGMRGLVFDLRNNPGGTVLDATAIVDKFVPSGETISTTWVNSADQDEDHVESETTSTDSETDRDYPVAVLINKCSASASEMTSGALQDLERAVVVGRTSWGKGIGQNSGFSVRGFTRKSVFGEVSTSLNLGITILEYFLPTGRSIQGIGVEPDVSVSRPVLLGERFDLVRRVRTSSDVGEYLDKLLESDPDLAARLAAFDGWDPSLYPGFDELDDGLGLELSRNLVRHGVRLALRDRLIERGELPRIDVQEDEDLRAGIAAIADAMELDLLEFEEYADLAP